METSIALFEKPKLRNPVLVEGLPGIGNVGRVAAGYLINELKMKKFAELYSPHFLPLVILHADSMAGVLKNEFYYCKGKGQDIIVFTGDTQSISSVGHYDICERTLEFAEKFDISMIITLGGFAQGNPGDKPKVIGAVNNRLLVKKYAKCGISFDGIHPTGTIVGASGLLLGLGRLHGIDAIALLGQTAGFPMLTDPKAADVVLQALAKILKTKLDLTKLESIIKDIEKRIEHTEAIHKEMFDKFTKSKEDVRYIG
jgi:uncharacterized protein (TIGR00162 family)